MRVNLGEITMTSGVYSRWKKDSNFAVFVAKSLKRYAKCDWGDTCKEDKELNNKAIENGERILAVYIMPDTKTKIWIITEWDRSHTTILFPNEY